MEALYKITLKEMSEVTLMSVLSLLEYNTDSIGFFNSAHEKLCPLCDHPPAKPYRRYNAQGKAIAGCIHPCHDTHLDDNREIQSIKLARLGIANHIIEASHTRTLETHTTSEAR